MPGHHDEKHHDHDDARHAKKGPGKGPKEREIAATLTAAAVTLAGSGTTYPTLDAAGDAIAQVYTRMFALVTDPPPKP